MSQAAVIRDIIENWAAWRDGGDFDRLSSCWHKDGRMVTTWGSFDAAAFVAASRAAWARGVEIAHLLGGSSVDVVGDRAVAWTRITIQQRGALDGISVDVTCIGRFFDLFEQRLGRWAIVLRQPTYERDRLDPVAPGAVVALDADLLGAFPVGYRHLGYLQTRSGMTVARDLPGLRGPAVDALHARGANWLAGGTAD